MTSHAARLRITLALLAAVVALPACQSTPEPVPYARELPRELKQEGVLDIQVFLETKHVSFTNTTGRAFGPSTVWLNGRFSRPIDGLAVGESVRLPLREFRDSFQDDFKGGGFFALQTPERLVLAQIETPRPDALSEGQKPQLFGMVVVRSEAE